MLYSCKTACFRYLAFQSYFRVVFERNAVITQSPQSSMSLNNMLFRELYIDLCIHTSSLCCMVLLGTSPTSFFGEVHFFFSGLTAGPTYRPPVRHSNPDAPLPSSLQATVVNSVIYPTRRTTNDISPALDYPIKCYTAGRASNKASLIYSPQTPSDVSLVRFSTA